MANPTRQELRKLWRDATGEFDPNIPPDPEVDDLLQAGLERFNDVTEYHVTDDTTSVTFVDGTQEYTLPTDCLKLLWVKWNGKFLLPTDQETLRNTQTGWNTRTGQPTHYYFNARSLGLFPTPDAGTVAAAASPVLRYVSTPAEVGATSAVALLATQHRRIPVYWAAAEWYAGRGGNPVKSEGFRKLFVEAAGPAKAVYEARNQLR